MSSPAPASSPVPARPAAHAAEIDASCRLPLLGLYYGAALWLVVSAVATLLASMSFHAPSMFADNPWLSHGRMAPIAKNSLLYGFCLPAGWATALWMLSRLGGVRLPNPGLVILGAKLWHLGVLAGVVGIAAGGSSGFENVEFPVYAAWLLWGGSVLLGISGWVAILTRRNAEMYPTQWFAGLGLLWFPWVYSTAVLLLQVWPVRGMTQAAVHGWYLAHLQVVLLGLLGVGAVFYFVPVLRQATLHSRHLALFALAGLVLFGCWVGVSYTVPLPAWMGALGKVMTVFLLLPVLAVTLNVWRTRETGSASETRFFTFAVAALLLHAVFQVLARHTAAGERLDFTVSHHGLFLLLTAGFGVMVGLGGAYCVLPRIAGRALPHPGFVRAHFWLAVVAVLLMAGAFLAGGFPQGARLVDPEVPFMDAARASLMPFRMASLGEVLWILGSLLFALNVVRLLVALAVDRVRAFLSQPADVPVTMEGRA